MDGVMVAFGNRGMTVALGNRGMTVETARQ